jgi:acyl carrier protein
MTETEALAWIAQMFYEPVERVTAVTTREEIPAWDSLGVLTLMASLDSDFGIILTDEEVSEMKSAKDILEILKRAGKLN